MRINQSQINTSFVIIVKFVFFKTKIRLCLNNSHVAPRNERNHIFTPHISLTDKSITNKWKIK